ncbi:hypothetical protein [Burkholderia sp. NLJ2]|uniref:hypothetical protein n=1 Tax=Burkholderia sp. NLJ2 TaxID=3090699 RepID=UPI003C6CA03D
MLNKLEHRINYGHATAAESGFVGVVQNTRFATNNLFEKIKAGAQHESRPSAEDVRLSTTVLLTSDLQKPDSSLGLAKEKLSAQLQKDCGISEVDARQIADAVVSTAVDKIGKILQEHKDDVHAKICGIMDFSTSRAINNAIVDSKPVQSMDARRGMDRRHAFGHDSMPSGRAEIIRSVMSHENIGRMIARDCQAFAEDVKAAVQNRAGAESNNVQAAIDRVSNKLLVKSDVMRHLAGGNLTPGQELARDALTLKTALKLVDAFMCPRPEVVQQQAQVFEAALTKYASKVGAALNESKDPEFDLQVKPSLEAARKEAWAEIHDRCGQYVGMDAQQSRMLKHMNQQFSDLNYGVGRMTATAGNTLALASIATQLLDGATIKALALAPYAGHVVKGTARFASSIATNAMAVATQQLSGDVVSNARMLRRYADADIAPPLWSNVIKSTHFKANREIIKTCEEAIDRMRSDSPPRVVHELAEVTSLLLHHLQTRFTSADEATQFLRDNHHLIGVLRDTCAALKSEDPQGYQLQRLDAVVAKSSFGKMSNEAAFLRLAVIEILFGSDESSAQPSDTLTRFAADIISQIRSADKRSTLQNRLSASADTTVHTLNDNIIAHPGHAAEMLVSISEELKGLEAIKSSAQSQFLDHTATDSSTRSTVRGAIINAAIPTAGGFVAAVPGAVAGTIAAPGVGTAGVSAAVGLVTNHIFGKLGALMAGEAVVKHDAKAAVDARLSKSILPGEGTKTADAIAKNIEQAFAPSLQKQHDAQIDAVVISRIDDLADSVAKHRAQIGGIEARLLLNMGIPDIEHRMAALELMVRHEKDVADINAAERTISRAATIAPVIKQAKDNVAAIHGVATTLGANPPENASDLAFTTRSIRSSKSSKSERLEEKIKGAHTQLGKLPEAAERGRRLLDDLAQAAIVLNQTHEIRMDEDALTNLVTSLMYPNATLSKDDLNHFRQRLEAGNVLSNSHARGPSLVEQLSMLRTEQTYDFNAIRKEIRKHQTQITACESDIAQLATDHFHYRQDQFDHVSDRFNIYHRANVGYDSSQMQARSYSEVSGPGLARAGARLAMAASVGTVSAAAGGVTTGVSSATQTLLGRDNPVNHDGFRAAMAMGGQIAQVFNPMQAPYLPASRTRAAERPLLKPDDLRNREGHAPFTFREQGMAGALRRMDNVTAEFLLQLLQGKTTHKTMSFDRHGTLPHPTHQGKMLGMPKVADPNAGARYDEIESQAKAGEGRSAKRRIAGEVGKAFRESFNSAKFALKALAPSDARAAASINKLQGEIIREVSETVQNQPSARRSAPTED